MFYRSANFDEEVFGDPHTFNILRSPNPHVGFGGTGCITASGPIWPKMTINLMFNAIADHMPDITSMGTPSGYVRGGSTASSTGGLTTPVRLCSSVINESREDSGGFHSGPRRSRPSPIMVTSVLDRDSSWDALVSGGDVARVPERLGEMVSGLPEIATALTEIGRHRDDLTGASHPRTRPDSAARSRLDAQQDRFLAGVGRARSSPAALDEPAPHYRPSSNHAVRRSAPRHQGAVPYAEQADWLLVTADSGVAMGLAEGGRRAGYEDAVIHRRGRIRRFFLPDVGRRVRRRARGRFRPSN